MALSACGREGKATASLPVCILSVFPPDSPPQRGVPLLAQACVSALNVTLSVYLKESLLGLLCCKEHQEMGCLQAEVPPTPPKCPSHRWCQSCSGPRGAPRGSLRSPLSTLAITTRSEQEATAPPPASCTISGNPQLPYPSNTCGHD